MQIKVKDMKGGDFGYGFLESDLIIGEHYFQILDKKLTHPDLPIGFILIVIFVNGKTNVSALDGEFICRKVEMDELKEKLFPFIKSITIPEREFIDPPKPGDAISL